VTKTSAIAKLPREVRNSINDLLDKGASDETVLQSMSVSSKGIGADDLRVWRETGFPAWRREQQRLAAMQETRRDAIRIARSSKGKPIQKAFKFAATQIYEILSDFDVASLKTKMEADPRHYALIVSVLAKISEASLEIERERAAAAAKKKSQKSPGVMTQETLEAIETEIKLL